VNGPPPRSAATSDFYSCILFFLLHSHRRANIWGFAGAPGEHGKLFSSTRRSYCGPTRYIRNRWACIVTRVRVYGAILQRRLCRQPRQQSIIHFILRTAVQFSWTTRLPDTVHAGQQPVSRAQTSRAANLSCSWASFPCLMPKRPPSRWGKVASNLVSLLYHRSALVRSGSLAHGGRSSTRNLSLHHTHWKS
jgi:hypothetical protein